jgi:hypothetical protein
LAKLEKAGFEKSKENIWFRSGDMRNFMKRNYSLARKKEK